MGCVARSSTSTMALRMAMVLGLSLTQTSECRIDRFRRRSDSESNQHLGTGSGSRSLQSTNGTDLTCRLTLFEFLENESQPKSRHAYMCTPVTSGKGAVGDQQYEILTELNDALRKEHKQAMMDGLETFVEITDAVLDPLNAHITLTTSSEIRLSEQHRKRRRKLAPKEGSLKALVVRIVMNDKQPMYDKSELYQITFQERVSLRGQYAACSFGKLQVQPTALGVVDARVNQYSTRTSNKAAVNEATTAALSYVNAQTSSQYTSLLEYADMVLFVTPDLGDWLAYASVGGGTSVFNDKWGGFVASVMHETGHNLGLFHAWEGEEYQDYTGYMGGAVIGYHDQIGFPAMCYNAENLWSLGWYSDRAIETDLYKPSLLKVAAFVDYDKTTAGEEYAVVKSGNIYVSYNRAKGMNEDTYEYKDNLILYQGMKEGSYLFSALSYPNKRIYRRTFPQGDFHTEICDQVFGDDRTTPDYLLVSIGFGDSLCPRSSRLLLDSRTGDTTNRS